MAPHGSGLEPSFAVGRVFKVVLLLKVTSGSLLWDSGDLVADGAFIRNGDPDGGLVWFRTVFFTGDAGNGLGDCLVDEVLGVYVEGGEGGLEEV